jgi:hypothetical protein
MTLVGDGHSKNAAIHRRPDFGRSSYSAIAPFGVQRIAPRIGISNRREMNDPQRVNKGSAHSPADRSLNRCSFPELVLGSSITYSIARGYL